MRWIVAIAALGLASGADAGTVVFSDGEYADPDWTVTVITVHGGGTTTSTTEPTGGNPGANRRTQIDLDPDASGDAFVWSVHIKPTAIYAPSSGGIASIDYSEDVAATDGGGGVPSACFGPVGMATGVALRQDGALYVGLPVSESGCSTTWTTAAQPSLDAASFALLDGVSGSNGLDPSVNPDFGALGSPIEFGFFRESGTLQNADRVNDHRFDNWSVTLSTVAAVPLPAWVPALLLAALLLLARTSRSPG